MMVSTGTERRPSAPALAACVWPLLAAAPAAFVAGASVLWLVGGLTGGGLWPAGSVSLAEAAAMHNRAEVVRLIGLGHDPNQPSRVRAGLPGADGALLTPLEAAVGARSAVMARTLLDHGALVDGPQLAVLQCYARMRPDAAVEALLAGLAGGTEPDCEHVELPARRW
jgi:hypothetical protein